MKTIYFKTLGCKVNSFDTDALTKQFLERGYRLATSQADADVTLINSCSVTSRADREARYLARKFRRASPDTFLIVTGCYAQTDSKRLAEMPEVDLVIPNQVKTQLTDLVQSRLSSARAKVADPAEKIPEGVALVQDNRQSHFKSAVTFFDSAASSKTRAFLKIQDGCNGFCAYCLIPYARGASRSVPIARVMEEVRDLIRNGIGEIVLTGIHIGDYGRDHGLQDGLAELLSQIIAIDGHPRLRISSLEPSEVSDGLLAIMKKFPNSFCDHFHLPLQSGSDRILQLMRRTYRRDEYRQAVEKLRAVFPNACIGADVIPGFPGETDEDHQETLALLAACQINYLHVFPYSKRPNTTAWRMPEHVPAAVVQQRAAELREYSARIKNNYIKRFLGTRQEVLWEKETDEQGRRKGHTRNYLDVVAGKGLMPQSGELQRVYLRGLLASGMILASGSVQVQSDSV